jgi:hypothetical protein
MQRASAGMREFRRKTATSAKPRFWQTDGKKRKFSSL